MEKTLSIIKPDAVERNLGNKIKSFFAENNLKVLKIKKIITRFFLNIVNHLLCLTLNLREMDNL